MTNFFQCEFKEIEVKQDIVKIKGWASTPDIDRYNDIVNPKAFNNAMEVYMNNPIILLQHNSDKPIGKTIEYKLNKKGLEVTIELTNDIDNTFQLVRDKILKGFSIGFIPKKWEYKMVGDLEIREITELDLIEISVVSTPANQNSLFTLSKSIKSFFDDLEKDNLKSNPNNMEVKEIIDTKVDEALEVKEIAEEVTEEVTEEVVEETIEEVTEEVSDEVETAGENPETTIINEEAEVKSVEVEEKVDDQAELKAEIKSLKDMVDAQKEELTAQKSLIDTVLDNVLELSKKTFEVKGMVDSLPIKKGLATLGVEKKTIDPLYKQLMDAKNNF